MSFKDKTRWKISNINNIDDLSLSNNFKIGRGGGGAIITKYSKTYPIILHKNDFFNINKSI